MILGFTGTRDGMSSLQRSAVRDFVFQCGATVAIHGCCVGADEQFHYICREFGLRIKGYPGHSARDPNSREFRSTCDIDCDETHGSLPFLSRNQKIVQESDHILAALKRESGGTWKTVQYAKSVRKPVTIILPNGKVME